MFLTILTNMKQEIQPFELDSARFLTKLLQLPLGEKGFPSGAPLEEYCNLSHLTNWTLANPLVWNMRSSHVFPSLRISLALLGALGALGARGTSCHSFALLKARSLRGGRPEKQSTDAPKAERRNGTKSAPIEGNYWSPIQLSTLGFWSSFRVSGRPCSLIPTQ